MYIFSHVDRYRSACLLGNILRHSIRLLSGTLSSTMALVVFLSSGIQFADAKPETKPDAKPPQISPSKVSASISVPKGPRSSDDDLKRELAKFRRAQVAAVDYEINLVMTKGSEEFSGKTTIMAELTRQDQPLSIDFLGTKILTVRVNGTAVTDLVKRVGSFDIPSHYLAKSNRIEIDYVTAFSKDGEGVMRVLDSEDGNEYVFTDFEPYGAHRLFPCFDQPDLKASYQIKLEAPKAWRAISNELVDSAKTEGDKTITQFKKSARFSTYLVFVGAGAFEEWTDMAGDIPLYIYARKALAKHVDAKRIFDVTKKALAFFNQYFDYKYPFSKYGQIFIPEFRSGAMENPGSVSFHERYIYRGPVTQTRLEGRDNTILHEMAHMWFGDLVTMNWWDDLWLNESFATYMASVGLDRAMGAKSSAWLDFLDSKTWGYWQDQLVTTHPIETTVPDVRTSKGNFDGITYSKGAAALKQLHFFVGEEGFRDGVRAYFKKYAFQNTSRADFIDAIAKAAKKDLSAWTKGWLQTAGPNRVQAKWTCKEGKIQSFALEQKPNANQAFIPHRTRVGLYMATENTTGETTQKTVEKIADNVIEKATNGTTDIATEKTPEKNTGKRSDTPVFEQSKTIDVFYSRAKTDVEELKGVSCPDFVYPNVDDLDYALFALDPISLAASRKAVTGGATDPLLRLMVWQTLSQMVRDTQLSILDYFETVFLGLEAEQDPALLGILLDNRSPLNTYFYQYLTAQRRTELAPRFENVLLKRLESFASGSDLQMTFWDFYVSIAQSPAANLRLNSALKGDDLPKGMELDQDRRWAVIGQLAANASPFALDTIAVAEKADPSILGQRYAYAARTAIPREAAKTKFWQQLEKPDEVAYSNLSLASKKFNHWNYLSLTAPFRKPFFEKVTSINWNDHDEMVEIYFEHLFPQNLCSRDLLDESRTKLTSAKALTPLAKRAWLEANDELSKCIDIRKKAGFTEEKVDAIGL